jgi:hypothetical protein
MGDLFEHEERSRMMMTGKRTATRKMMRANIITSYAFEYKIMKV